MRFFTQNQITPAGGFDELMVFGEIFFGSLIVATAYFGYRHVKHGLSLPGSQRFDWTVLILGLWCFVGMSVDGWGHKHGAVDDSFFTPWHAIWYSGFTAYASFITIALWRLHDGPLPTSPRTIKQFLSAMPAGYSSAVAGMVVFSLAGFGDMLWHTFLGIEGGIDILLSPTHLGLAAGLALTLMAPFWSAWHNPNSGKEGLSSQIPMLFALGATWSVLTLFTSYAHHQTISYNSICAVANGCPDGNQGLELGITSILLQSAILTGFILLFMKRWRPAPGAFTILLGVNGLAIAAFAPGELKVAWKHILVPIIAGVILDLIYKYMPKDKVRTFAFIIPASHTLTWILIWLTQVPFKIATSKGYPVMSPFGWTIHSTIGTVFLAGCVGVLMSIVINPPELPHAEDIR
jgi:hypothetical protein